jgi:excisionase family DNA binding protein
MIHSRAALAQPQKLLSVDVFAETLSLSAKTIRVWIAARKIARVKLGRAVRIPVSEADRLIANGLEPAKS